MPVKCRCPECNALLSFKSLPDEIDCPKCGTSFEPNEEETEAPPSKKKSAPRSDRNARSRDDDDEPPARRRRNRDDDDDDADDDYEDTAPRRKSKKGRGKKKPFPIWIPISIGGGVIVIVIVVILLMRGGKKGGGSDGTSNPFGSAGGANQQRAQNNLKQVALAVHIYHDANGQFPFRGLPMAPGSKPKLSWRVAILPYIEEGELYRQFHLDEPWDSEHNKRLIPRMPKIYAQGSSDTSQGQTPLRVFNSAGTYGLAKTFIDVPDGTSNSIMVVESNELVPWTKPDDFPLDPRNPKAKLGQGRINVALGDGQVRTFDLAKISDDTLRNAITVADGQLLGKDWDQ